MSGQGHPPQAEGAASGYVQPGMHPVGGVYPAQGYPGADQQMYGYGVQPGYPGNVQVPMAAGQVAPGMVHPGAKLGKHHIIGLPAYMPTEDGTVRAEPSFTPNSDAMNLKSSMRGVGHESKAIMDVLCRRTNFQRQLIAKTFNTMYQKDLVEELKGELTGHFEDLTVALMDHPATYDARSLHRALDRLNTKESSVNEILITRNNNELRMIKEQYKKLYTTPLEEEVEKRTSGEYTKLLGALLTAGRNELSATSEDAAKRDAELLYKAGEKRWGTDESAFRAVVAFNSFDQLKLVFQEYEKLTGHGIDKAIKSEFSGDTKDALRTIVKVADNRPAYFAKKLYKTMKGLGTNDKSLIRLMVTRSEIDMELIKKEFELLAGKSLAQYIREDTSGHYSEMLLLLAGEEPDK